MTDGGPRIDRGQIRKNPSLRYRAQDAADRATGATLLSITSIAAGLINYAYSFGLSFELAVGSYAVFAAGQALLIVAGTIAGASIPWLLAYEIGKHTGDRLARRQAVTFTNLANAAQGIATGVVVAAIASRFASPPVVALLGACCVAMFLASSTIGYLQGLGRFRAIAGWRIVEVVAKIGSGGLAVALGYGAFGALVGFLVADLVVILGGVWVMRKDLRPALPPTGERKMLRNALGLAGIQGLVAVMSGLDTVLIAVMAVPRVQVASYQLAVILSRGPLFFSAALSTVAFQAMVEGHTVEVRIVWETTRELLILSGAAALIVATVPPSVLGLVLPTGYGGTARYLSLTASAGVCYALLNLTSTFFQADLRFRQCIVVLLGGMTVQVAGIAVGYELGGAFGVGVGALCGAVGSSAVLMWATAATWPTSHVRPSAAWTVAFVVIGSAMIIFRAVYVWIPTAGLLAALAAWTGLFAIPVAESDCRR